MNKVTLEVVPNLQVHRHWNSSHRRDHYSASGESLVLWGREFISIFPIFISSSLHLFQHLDEVKTVGGGSWLALSRGSCQMTCTNAYMEVRDGYYSGSPLIGKFIRFSIANFLFREVLRENSSADDDVYKITTLG